jgi:hypothetical protein
MARMALWIRPSRLARPLAAAAIALVLAASCKRERPPPEEFWSWFAANAERMRRTHPELLVRDPGLRGALDRYQAGLIPEFHAREVEGRRQIIISADGDRDLFPAVETLVAAAPDIPGWRVIAFRPREPRPRAARQGDLPRGAPKAST